MNTFSKQYDVYYKVFERELTRRCADMKFFPPVLAESMQYSLLSGGKRVRPVLFLSALDALGVNFEEELPLGIALEAIHTYSLIHDDLPAMDNDDYRRGRLSNHKKFGEANAILAGDALLSYAFDIIVKECGRDRNHHAAAQVISDAAGANGMIAGQSADLYYSGRKAGRGALQFIYLHKTAKLIRAPLVAAACIAGKDSQELGDYGEALGVLFQLTDDLLDVKGEQKEMGKTPGKDEAENKLTCVKLFGVNDAEKLADEYAEKCRTAIGGISVFLTEFVDFVRYRNH